MSDGVAVASRKRMMAVVGSSSFLIVGCLGGRVLAPHSAVPAEILRITGGAADGRRSAVGRTVLSATHPGEQLLAPGAERILCDLHGAGTIRRIWVRGESIDAGYLDNLALEAYWEGATNPAISVTLGELAAIDRADAPPFASAVVHWGSGAVVLDTPMPFTNRARLRLLNVGTTPVRRLGWEIDIERGPTPAVQGEGDDHFCARRFDANLTAPERAFLQVGGSGRYLGTTLRVHGVDPGTIRFALWPDANQRRAITSQNVLIFLGSSGLGRRLPVAAPEWGLTERGSRAAAGYRWHISAPLHFTSAMALHCDVAGALPQGATLDGAAFWYQKSAQGIAPAAYLSHPARIPVREGAIEGESLLPPLYSSGDPCGEEITTLFGDRWSGNAQLVLEADAVGDFVVLDLAPVQPGTYDLHLAYTLGSHFGTARASVMGDPRPGALLAAQPHAALGTREVTIPGVRIVEEDPRLLLRLTMEGGNRGADETTLFGEGSAPEATSFRVGLDYLRLERRRE
jgi:hypothetical protein